MANLSLLIHCSDSSPHIEQAIAYLSQLYVLSPEKIAANPDLHVVNSDTTGEDFSALKIEQVRDLAGEMQLRPFQGIGELKQAIFVICKIELASVPAQNALLKSLEEPPEHVQFVLTSSQPQRVLPTILSRVKIVESILLGSTQSTQDKVEFATFSSKTYTDLMELAGSYKEKPEAVNFVKNLLTTLHADNIAAPSSQKTAQIAASAQALEYLQKNVNTRLVLEDLLFQFKKN